MTKPYAAREVWFLTGSQGLYGREIVAQVAAQSREVARTLDAPTGLPTDIVWKPVLTDPAAIRRVMLDANSDPDCVGRHHLDAHLLARPRCGSPDSTRSQTPLLHLHTQANVELPWAEHRLRLHEPQPGRTRRPRARLHPDPARRAPHDGRRPRLRPGRAAVGSPTWLRAAAGWAATHNLRLVRFGDNMRDVAVTEGDKIEAEITLRGLGQHLRRQRPGRRRSTPCPTRRSTRWRPSTSELYDVARRAATRRRTGTSRCATPRGRSWPCARFLDRRRAQALHDQLRGPRRAATAAGPRRPTADGPGLRLRRPRATGRPPSWCTPQGHGPGPARRDLPHGGLHLRPHARATSRPRRAHARGLPVTDRRPHRGSRSTRWASATARIRCAWCSRADPGQGSWSHRRHARPVPADRERRRRRHRHGLAAEPAGRPGDLEAAAGLHHQRRVVAHRRRRAPHRAVHRGRDSTPSAIYAELLGPELLVIDGGTDHGRVLARGPLEPGLLPAGRRAFRDRADTRRCDVGRHRRHRLRRTRRPRRSSSARPGSRPCSSGRPRAARRRARTTGRTSSSTGSGPTRWTRSGPACRECYAALAADVRQRHGVELRVGRRARRVRDDARLPRLRRRRRAAHAVPHLAQHEHRPRRRPSCSASASAHNIPHRWSVAHLYQAILDRRGPRRPASPT